MHTTLRHTIILSVLTVLLCSCGVTSHIPNGEYLLEKNEVILEGDASRKNRVPASQIESYIKQSANKRFLGTNFYLWVYNLANPQKNNMFSRMYRRMGQAPILLDTTQIHRSITNISNFMESSGYYDSKESFTLETNAKNKKATVIYKVDQGTPYRIGKISYQFRDNIIGPVIMADSANTLLHSGEVFNENILNEERSRISTLLKNKGYFNFAVDNIQYFADSTAGNHTINLRMLVKKYVAGYNDRGEPILENFTVYRIRNIYINPDYDPVVGMTDTLYTAKLDTISYRGLNILCHNSPRVRKEILRQLINIYPNHIYEAKEVNRTYENIMRLGFYKSASVLFTEVKGGEQNMITFIGGGSETEDQGQAVTTEGYLDCTILCTPALKQSYKIEFEASTNSNFYAFTGTLGYQNRNILKGADLLDVSFKGGYELMHIKGKKGSYEVGGSVGLTFPRLITPIKIDRYNKLNNTRSKLEFSISSQRRPYYNRTLSGVTWGYSWNSRKYSNYTLRPIDVSLVKMGYINKKDFFDQITNKYLRNSYQSQLIAGISGSYLFNNQKLNTNSNSITFRFNAETTGNLISGLSRVFNTHEYADTAGLKYNKVFGIRYAQYFRSDASFANKIRMSDRSSIVYRLYAGAGIAYGNSTSIPYDRLFYCGGSNSMRGWMVRTLGPGSAPEPNNERYPQQVGDLKLEANLEARFPVWGIFHGAVFFDLGNIWFMRKGEDMGISEDEVFGFDSFYKQLGLNTGLGLRLDLNFVILRFDWGIKLHNPNWAAGERWVKDFRLRNTTINFGVGYPF